jgi:hypothetical protein
MGWPLPSNEFLLCHLNNDVFRTTSSWWDSMYRMSNVTGLISVWQDVIDG